MPTAPILTLGAQWKASDVYWHTTPTNARLCGKPAHNRRGREINFAKQTGIYVLYANFTPIYVGQCNQSLFSRLRHHCLRDDLAGRWDRFTWFGLRRALGNGNLSHPESDFQIARKQLLDHLEALLIHAFEPVMNGQEGRFGDAVVRFKQVRDTRLGPDDRELLEQIAKVGKFLAPNQTITRRGWR